MTHTHLTAFMLALATTASAETLALATEQNSVALTASTSKCDAVTYELKNMGKTVMSGTLGISTTLRSFEQLKLVDAGCPQVSTESYDMLQGKRMHITTKSKTATYTFVNSKNDTLCLEMRVANDGMAFRYTIPQAGREGEKMQSENTTFVIKNGVNRWIAAYDPGYEQFFPLAIDGKDLRGNQNGRWGYPALVEPQPGQYVLLAESNIERDHAGALLVNNGGESYRVTYASQGDQPCEKTWTSPWRLVIAGSLATVTESTMVTDVARPAVCPLPSFAKPAPVSWIYWAYNHGSRELNIIKEYIDLAVTMKWPYMLIDAEWDEMTNGNRVEEALEYAHKKGVKPMLWYNSCTGWIDGAPGPKWRLNKKEDREREFAWLCDNGVVGIKIDFFGGDDVLNNNYCIDILEDALKYDLMIVFHGATIPRGWQRTYPNLMTVEAVYGAEWYNNNGVLTNRAACHNATLPFTRNIIGPMDYTPCAFSDSQHPHITSHGHELALPVLFESALQHMADRPSSYTSQPVEVQQMLSTLPTAWDETRLMDAKPGHHVVMARRSGSTWYVAGINGTDEPMTLTADIAKLVKGKCQIDLFADGKKQLEFSITHPTAKLQKVNCLPRGGFVAVVKQP